MYGTLQTGKTKMCILKCIHLLHTGKTYILSMYVLDLTHRKNMHSKHICIACYKQQKKTQYTSIAIPTGDVKKYPTLRVSSSQYMTKATTPF